MSDKPITWGTTAALTKQGQDHQWRLAKLGAALLALCVVAQVAGAQIPAEAYLAVSILLGAGHLGLGWLTSSGTTAHAGQYRHGSPTAQGRPIPSGLTPAHRDPPPVIGPGAQEAP